MVAIKRIETGIYEWAALVLPIGVPVIWVHQNSPRPIVPYVALHLSTITSIGRDFIDGEGNLTGNRDFVLLCQGIGNYSMDYLEILKTSLELPLINLFLQQRNIVYVDRLALNCISEVVDNRFEERNSLDLKFRFAQISKDESGTIDGTNIQGTVKNIDLSTVAEINIQTQVSE
jgi:hypothetical protein